MDLKAIFIDQFTICAVTNRGDCDFETALFNEIDDAYSASRANLVLQLEALSRHGFATENYYSKRVNDEHDIWELKAAKLRALYFKGEHPNIIICTDLHIKKTQKVSSKAVNKAITYKARYIAALDDGEVNIIEDDYNADE